MPVSVRFGEPLFFGDDEDATPVEVIPASLKNVPVAIVHDPVHTITVTVRVVEEDEQ
jgi:hypothetical protein